ncbi:hypothetical protein ACRRTK_023578 [Alexandromys fortis]
MIFVIQIERRSSGCEPPLVLFCCCCCCLFFEIGFLCGFGACPGTSSVDQAGLELTEIRLPLPPECWD